MKRNARASAPVYVTIRVLVQRVTVSGSRGVMGSGGFVGLALYISVVDVSTGEDLCLGGSRFETKIAKCSSFWHVLECLDMEVIVSSTPSPTLSGPC